MNLRFAILNFLGAGAVCALLSGCLFKAATVTNQRFVLTPVQAESHASGAGQPAIGLGRIRMPDYLLNDSMAVRKSDFQIEYLENALWAERLDHSFQRVLAANLSAHLPDNHVRLSPWQPGEVTLAVRVNIERLDVDPEGRGTLIARWQIESADSGKVLKNGEANMSNTGAKPYADPATIAKSISDLTSQFSQNLAQAIRESGPSGIAR